MESKLEIKRIYSLSKMQQGILFHTILNQDIDTYFIQICIDVEGEIDIELFEKSFNILVERYDVLRTAFVYKEIDKAKQIVVKQRRAKINLHDISYLGSDEKDFFIKDFLHKDCEKGFNLSKDMLTRIAILKTDNYSYKVIWSNHHIILDGWSMNIIVNEILEIYQSLKNEIVVFEKTINPYENYIKWINKQDHEEALQYWREYLETYSNLAILPSNEKIQSSEAYSHENISFEIDESTTNCLRALANDNLVTLNTVLQAVWGILLQRYNDVSDVVFGGVVSGRPSEIAGIDKMVGLFINTIPVRVTCNENDTFAELLKSIQQAAIKAEKFSYTSLAEIQANSQLKNSLINNIMIFENYPVNQIKDSVEGSKKSEFVIHKIDIFEQTNYDFNIIVLPGKKLVVKFAYNALRYKQTFLMRIQQHFNEVIKQIIDNSNIKVNEIDIVSEEERKELIYDFNNTTLVYNKDKTIHELFENQVINSSNKIAIICDDSMLTYEELNNKANQLARKLRDNGVKPDSIVGIMTDRSVDMIIGILGILKAGGAYLPIDSNQPKERIKHIIEDSGAKILITQVHLKDKVIFTGTVFYFNSKNFYIGATTNLTQLSDSSNLAYVIYTSGSTGNPKGVMIEHRPVINFIMGIVEQVEFSQDKVILALTTMSFDIFVLETIVPIVCGMKVIIATEDQHNNPDELGDLINRENVEILQVTPSRLQLLISGSSKLEYLNNLKEVLVGGETFPDNLMKELKKLTKARIFNLYGPTETTIWSTIKELTVSDSVNIGKPIANTQIYVINKNNKLQPVGIPGELCISGDGLARGYMKRAELTNTKFIPSIFSNNNKMYKTGDSARWLENGELECLGRVDYQVKIRGFRIELGEIESKLIEIKDIKEVVVLAKGEEINKYLCAYYVSEMEYNTSEIKEELKEYLPDYMVPSHYIHLESMPLNTNGKIDRKVLLDIKDEVNTEIKYEAPRNGTEKKLITIFEEILGVDNIGINDNFFEMGGHSLKATILMSKIHKELNKEIPLKELFRFPTIKDLSKLIEPMEENLYLEIERLEENECYEVSSAQKRMYILQQIEKSSTAYNMPIVFELKGQVDKDKIEATFQQLFIRHDSLRTYFETVHGEIMQKVQEVNKFKLIHKKKDTHIDEIIQNFIKPFDLSKASLFRVEIVENIGRTYLLIDMHHIISDGTSLNILMNEFSQIYNGKQLRNLDIQYKDFSAWQKKLINSKKMRENEEYWINRFSDEIPQLDLPTDYERPSLQSFEGDIINFDINEQLTSQLRTIAKEAGVTMHMVLLSVINILLTKYSGQEDIVIGTPISGRTHEDVQNIIGMFVNTLPIRNYPFGIKSYEDFLEEVKDNCIKAYENQEYQFEDLVDKLNLQRNTSRNPLFDVMLISQNMKHDTINLNDCDIEQYLFNNRTSKFDLLFSTVELDEKIYFELQYCSKLFNRNSIEKMIKRLINIIVTITNNRQIKISEIDILFDEERKNILFNFNSTDDLYDKTKTIHKLFEEQVQKTPNNIALVFNSKQITYKEVEERSNKLANFLVSKCKVVNGDRVGIYMERSEHLIISILGILKSGASYVPINSQYPINRIKVIIEDCNINTIITSRKQIHVINKLQLECTKLKNYICMDSDNLDILEEVDGNDLMNEGLWDYIVESSTSQIGEGGWKSSYTGEEFSSEEMQEYTNNTLQKLTPYLNKSTKVLEIGCSSGLTMFEVAPYVETYYGVDMSNAIIEKNKARIRDCGIENIKLMCLQAHKISEIGEKDFDIVIINSVIQYFPGVNYLRSVIRDSINLLNSNGIIFIGDIMDSELKEELITSLIKFKNEDESNSYKTKDKFDSELFLPRKYFEDLLVDFQEIMRVEVSNKIHTIKNELTKYRYDCLLRIEKQYDKTNTLEKHIYQYNASDLEEFSSTLNTNRNNASSDDVAYVIFTSGSTGKPKGVEIKHKSVINFIHGFTSAIDFSDHNAILLLTNITFDIFVLETFLPLSIGLKIIIADDDEQITPKLINKLINDWNIDIIQATPSRMNLLINDSGEIYNFRNLKKILIGGESLRESLLNKITQITDAKIYNVYGPTETTVWSTLYELSPPYKITIGKPISNTQIYIVDKYIKPVPIGVSGELYIAGDGLAKGYLNAPELTAQKFINNPFMKGTKMFKTGDIARWLPDGNIECGGRKDYQVKIKGIRIELGEIESQLLNHELVKEAVVIDRDDTQGNKVLYAYVVSNAEMTLAEIREWLSRELPDYMIPSYFKRIEKMPLTSSGKIDRNALLQIEAEIDAGVEFIAPRSKIEKKLASIWMKILGVNSIGIDDNYFRLGGDSIKAVQISARFRENEYNLEVSHIFEYQTIRLICEQVTKIKQCQVDTKSQGLLLRESNFKLDEVAIEELTQHISQVVAQEIKIQDIYMLTPSQERMLFHSLFFKDKNIFFEHILVEIDGYISSEIAEKAFNIIIQKYDVLKTIFSYKKLPQPAQIVLDGICEKVRYKDISDLSESSKKQFIESYKTKDKEKGFNLLKDIPIRLALIKTDDRSYNMILSYHHIIMDGWSIGIVLNDFLETYGLLKQNALQKQNTVLEQQRYSFSDYVKWINNQNEEEAFLFWEKYLKDYEQKTIFSKSNVVSENKGYINEQKELVLNKDVTKALSQIAKDFEVTLSNVFQAIWGVMLREEANTDDIVYGIIVSGRNSEIIGIDKMVGLFVTAIPIRIKCSDKISFCDLTKEIKNFTSQSEKYSFYPVLKLQEKLGIVKGNLFNHIIAYENYPVENVLSSPYCKNMDLNVRNIEHLEQTSYDLNVVVIPGDETKIKFNYNSIIYNNDLIKRLEVNFNNIVNQIIEVPNIIIKDISIND